MGIGNMRHRSANTRAGRFSRRYAVTAGVVAALGLLCLARPLSAAEPVKLDKPVRVSTTAADKSRVAGRVASYDDAGFELLDDKGVAKTVAWSSLPARSVMEVYALLLAKGSAQDWVAAGRVMYHLEGGKDYGEKAFTRALRTDPKVKAAIEEARTSPPAGAATAGASKSPPGTKPGEEMLGDADTRVTSREEYQKKLWGPQSEADQAKAVEELKQFAGNTIKGKQEALRLFETKYFLFYSDLNRAEAERWAGLLDRMYDRLAELFAVPKGQNLWRGKCLIFVFAKPEDYHAHEAAAYKTRSQGTAGLCHSFGTGFVHVAFYRQPEELQFAHILVHESVHGFLHRYRSHVHIPSWANEGLAEVIASELVPQKPKQTSRRSSAIEELRIRGGVGATFFTAQNIEAWQYAVAENLCSFMIQQNKRGYVAFVNAIKDGVEPDEALAKHYGADKERIVPAYMAWMGIKPKGK